MQRLGTLSSYLIEIFKNHKIIKIFQKEEYEKNRSREFIETLKETQRKIGIIFVRTSPIMESLTGIMIAIIIFVSAKLIMKNELEVSNFFSFLAAMMLAYQPVRSLATLNISIQQGLAGARNVLPIIDEVPKVKDDSNAKELNVTNGTIIFENVDFKRDFYIGIRPEDISFENNSEISAEITVDLVENLGSERIFHTHIKNTEMRIKSFKNIKDKNITIYLPKNKLYLFDINKNRLKT